MSWLLELRQLRLVLGRCEVLQDLSLQLAHGEWLGLVGANGAGKSSLLKLVATLATPDAGEILVEGRAITDPLHWRRQLGLVRQRPAVWATTVRDNLAYPLRLRRGSLEPVDRWLERLELTFYANYRPADLSVGEMQRLALGRALIAEPRLLLLDDPTAGGDLQTDKLIETLVGEFHTAGGTVLWATPARGALPPGTQTVRYLFDGSLSCDPPSAQLFSGWE